MAIELLPLLEGEEVENPNAGTSSPPTTATVQDLTDYLHQTLDSGSSETNISSWAYKAWLAAESGWDAIVSAGAALKDGLGSLGAPLEDGWNALGDAVRAIHDGVDTIQSALGWSPTDPTVAERFDAISATGGDQWWSSVPFDTADTRWVLVDTDTFTDATHFVADGHVYLVSLVAPINSRSEELIDGETVRFGAGWWSEMVGTHRGERHYLDFEDNIIHQRGTLMHGVFVNLPKGGDGQVAAYRFTP